MNRARRGEKIFETKEDYWFFVDLLEKLDEDIIIDQTFGLTLSGGWDSTFTM